MLIELSSVLWIITTLFIIITAIYLTFYFNLAQFKLSKRVKQGVKKDTLKYLFISLSGKIGVGSISGIAVSILVGGKGTILWIWLSSIILSIFTYLEVKTGIKYKKKINNTIVGGPLVYIEKYNYKLLSKIYITLMIITYLFAFILIQSNTLLNAIKSSININEILLLVLLIILIIKSISNGLNTISKLIMILFPIMAISYLLIGIYVLINNINQIPGIIRDIFKESLSIRSIISLPLIIGFQRSIFANEVGVGTTSMILSTKDTDDYEQETYIQLFGMYFISLIICTITALIILTTKINITNFDSIEIINYSFIYHFGKYGPLISTVIISIFAFSTILTSYYYGNICLNYLFNIKNNKIAKIIVIIVVILSNYINCSYIWAFVDIVIALLTFINVFVLFRIREKIRSI